MVHLPNISNYISNPDQIDDGTKHAAHQLEVASDNVDNVNVLKLKLEAQGAAEAPAHTSEWDDASKFDKDTKKEAFRDYENACERVKDFYKKQHEKQTVEFNTKIREYFYSPDRIRHKLTIPAALRLLSTLTDESDPDTGDTFVVGAKPEGVILPETFSGSPDSDHPVYSTKYGIYKPECGIENLMLAWGHDEYLYLVLKDQCLIPAEGLAMIRLHSFYPFHREGAYKHFMAADGSDEKLLKAVQAFNPYDLYSKDDEDGMDVDKLWSYYEDLITEFFPNGEIEW